MHRCSVIACARWETPYIAEWIAYYAAIGFDHIYLHCNDDDPSELAEAVAVATRERPGFVTFTHFPGQGRQRDMYLDALRTARAESEWLTFLDIDEFLVLRGVDDVNVFMERFPPGVDSVHFNWVYFGNNGFIERPPGSVLRQYTVRAQKMNANTKHLTRARELTDDRLVRSPFPFWHGLADPIWSELKRINVIGEDVAPLLRNFPRTADDYLANPAVRDSILSCAVVNHYAFKSESDFMLRAKRGTAGDFGAQANYRVAFETGNFRFILDDLNQVEDTYLAKLSTCIEPGSAAPTPPRVPLPPTQKVHVRHKLWIGDLELGSNGRVRHVQHRSLGSYQRHMTLMRIKWDKWPNEDVLCEHDGVFSSYSEQPESRLPEKLDVELGPVRLL